MNTNFRISNRTVLAAVLITLVAAGCVGRTGKIGTPIAARYSSQLSNLKVGESAPSDLKGWFGENKVSLKETKIENGKTVEIWELARGGNMDAGALILWGYVAYDKDQSIIFRFEDGKLISYESVVHPDKSEKSK